MCRDMGRDMDIMDFETTDNIKVPEKLIDNVIGQDEAVTAIKRAAKQKRFVFLLGDPGTGKSMLGNAMSELLPVETQQDILIFPNKQNRNFPLVKTVKAGEGDRLIKEATAQKGKLMTSVNFTLGFSLIVLVFVSLFYGVYKGQTNALFLGVLAVVFLIWFRKYLRVKVEPIIPKKLVNNAGRKNAPFVDATGANAGALLGDVRHDPFQSGGVETPIHELVEAGAVHKANGGVLFIDEVASLSMESQQSLLTAIQEKKFPITGRNPLSSGAMVQTEPVPCDFNLVLAGNEEDLKYMHPALRSRIRGYGYEILMRSSMDDTPENRRKIVQFVAQEVKKDSRIPPFSKDATMEIIRGAKRMSRTNDKLTLKLRALGGLVRAAGDVARTEDAPVVESKHVFAALDITKSLEVQKVERYVNTEMKNINSPGWKNIGGATKALSTIEEAGLVMPIFADTTPAQRGKGKGRVITQGPLEDKVRGSINLLGAILMNDWRVNIMDWDVYIQLVGDFEDIELENFSISVAVAAFSALKKVSIREDTGLTGTLGLGGLILPVNNINQRIKAAINAGLKRVIIPKANLKDIALPDEQLKKIDVLGVESFKDVVENSVIKKN